MSKIDKQALREAAEKATPDDWKYSTFDCAVTDDTSSLAIVRMDSGQLNDEQSALNGAFIAAANPATVLALLDELEAADALNRHFELAIRKAEGCSEALRRKIEVAEKRIAELQAREGVVNIKPPVIGRAYSALNRVWTEQEVRKACELAGIKLHIAAAGKGE